MGAVLSLIRNWLLGLGLFAGGTAAVAVALSFAIAGPPTDEEMSALSGFTDDAMREGGALAERAAASFCAEVDICETAPVTVAEAPPSMAPPPLPEPEVVPEPASEIVVTAPLLGGQDNAPRIEARRQRAEPRGSRRELRARAERARPAPLQTPRQSTIEHLAEREAPAIQDVPAAYQADFGPDDQQQVAQQPADDQAYYDEHYADNEGSYDGWEDDWRAERRARREQRRREEERYYEDQSEEAPPEEYWPAY
ncbi:hypothetical protein [Terricaulis silvestris]|uniref:Uncharacterized protein n=1 Tax=Terricaulis silvestris TaxID=2686094 RepID=A0A6I6MHG6_9CAUL|nr:hypothetical protein [Terricaulis silvestris]QGZ94335.1 hypothetical protein DSM104635_01153 [Terricaulis silvestris]